MENKHLPKDSGPLSLAEMLAYLEGRLSPEATAEMDAHLATSPEDVLALEALTIELEEGSLDADGIRLAETDFLAALGEVEGTPASLSKTAAPESPVIPLKKARSFRAWWAVVAAILILAIPAVLLWPRGMSGGEAFNTYFEPYENVVTARAGSTPTDTRIRLGLEAYDAFLYEEASRQFQKRLAEDATDLYASLYGGISLLALDQPEAAIPPLSFVADGNSAMQQQGIWYLALAHLQLGQEADARKRLNALASGKGKYPKRARALLADL